MADGITLDAMLKIGEIVAIVGSLGVGLFTIGRSTSRIETVVSNQGQDIMLMQSEIKKLAEVITVQAVQTTRIDNLAAHVNSIDQRLEDLRRGDGIITRLHKTTPSER